MQVLDCDYTMVNQMPLIRIFGKNRTGRVYCAFVTGTLPYFYFEGDPSAIRNLAEQFGPEISRIEKVKRFKPIGYAEKKSELVQITCTNPASVPRIRDYLNQFGRTYEADILFIYRYLVDSGLGGMGWVEIDGRYVKTTSVRSIPINANKIKALELDDNVQLKKLAFDIEVETPINRVPTPDLDKIIMISLAFSEPYLDKKNLVLTAKPIRMVGRDVICLQDEKEMLEKFYQVVQEYDPDVITGYNCNSFDLPFIIERMRKHKLKTDLGRVVGKPSSYRKIGPRTRVSITGRIVVDSYQLVKKDFMLKTYDLSSVAKEILNLEKKEIRYKDINKLWMSPTGIKKLIEYTRRDAELALILVEKKKLLDKYIALAKVSRVLLQDVLDGGEATKIENLLLAEFNKKGYILPNRPSAGELTKRSDRELKGGLVLQPKAGLHTSGLILALDFKSLYPSIFQTYNICPTTYLTEKINTECHVSPSGAKFISAKIRRGIIPQILQRLVRERGEVKRHLIREEREDRREALNAKQYALKVMANAFYGYCGYERARTYVLDIANAITSFGRNLIKQAKEKIEAHGLEVIYGDTDSLFVRVRTDNIEQADKLGKSLAEEISSSLPGALELEFEKIFKTFLILTKKRYAGWAFEKRGEKWVDKIEMKGIETVRRDWCSLTTKTMSHVLEILLREQDINKAIKHVQKVVGEVEAGKVDLEELAVTKSITKRPEDYAGVQPHVELAKKIKKRDPALAPTIGDRVSFLIVKGDGLVSKRAESVEYVKAKGLEVDSKYYLESNILPPLERIFAVLDVQRDQLLGRGRQSSIMESFGPRAKERKKQQTEPVRSLREFICGLCSKKYRRPPLSGICSCSGKLLASDGERTSELIELN